MRTPSPCTPRARSKRGFAVLEALLAASALALGLLAATRLAERAWQASAHSRALAQAQLLAREALDCALAQAGSAAVPCPAPALSMQAPSAFEVVLAFTPLGPQLQEVWVQVSWSQSPSPSPTPQRLRWGTRVFVPSVSASGPDTAAKGASLDVSSGP